MGCGHDRFVPIRGAVGEGLDSSEAAVITSGVSESRRDDGGVVS